MCVRPYLPGTQKYFSTQSRHPDGQLRLPQNGWSVCLIFLTRSAGLWRRSIRRSTYGESIDHTVHNPSTLWRPVQIIHFGSRPPQFPIHSCPIPQHAMQTELGPAFQYFSTTLTTPPNRRPDAHSCFASDSPLTVITIVEPPLFPVSCCSLRRSSFKSQRRRADSCILVKGSTSRFSNSIFFSPRYLSSDIPCTLSRCQCSNISTPNMAAFTVFAARISTFDNRGMNNPAVAFSIHVNHRLACCLDGPCSAGPDTAA